VDGSGSMCFGSHDAQRDKDPSTTGSDDANGTDDRWQQSACVLTRAGWLSRVRGQGEEAFVSGSGGCRSGDGRRRRAQNVTEQAGWQQYHQQTVLSLQAGVSM